MARTGISPEQVFAAADALVAEGRRVTLKTLREALGTGSPNTIQTHLQAWKFARPHASSTPAKPLPSAVIDAINKEIERMTVSIRSDLEAQLDEAQRSANQLAEVGTALERDIDEMQESVGKLTSERDKLEGKAAEQADELTKLRTEVEKERQAAESARVAIAKERLRSEGNVAQLADQAKEIERLRALLDDEQRAGRKAEQTNAVLTSEKASMNERLAEVSGREKRLQEKLNLVEEREREAMVSLATTGSALEGAKASLEAVRQENKELRIELKALKTPPACN